MDQPESKPSVESLLEQWQRGDSSVLDDLIGLLHDELRGLAAHRLQQHPGNSLVPTELFHEAFVKLVKAPGRSWENKRHFVNAAGAAMRTILVDRARARLSRQRREREAASDAQVWEVTEQHRAEYVIEVHRAIESLQQRDGRSAQVVCLRFFSGMTEPEIAVVLGVSERTVRRDWVYAKAWLSRHIPDGLSGCESDGTEGG